MCGIAGGVGRVTTDTVSQMMEAIRHRGPDDSGMGQWGPAVLGMRRLSIIDLAGGHQPMVSADGNVSVIFNGEIYNYQELRQQLEPRYPFTTTSDTETILHGYDAWGLDVFSKLNGMFAIAIWDQRQQRLVLGRDRVGEKPLFYWSGGDGFYFASELKCFRAVPGWKPQINQQSVLKYLDQGYVGGNNSIFENVYKLPPGHYGVYQNNQLTATPYWILPEPTISELSMSPDQVVGKLDGLLRQSVINRLVSDVPLGVFLSGGIDSSLITAYAAQAVPGRLKTFTIRFSDNKSFDESGQARQVAQLLGTEHYEDEVSAGDLTDVVTRLPQLMDEPQADTSFIPTYWLARATRQHVTVALSGDGGDEFFGGYQTFQAWRWWQYYQRLPQGVRHQLSRLALHVPTGSGYFSLGFKIRRTLGHAANRAYDQHFRWFSPFTPEALSSVLSADVRSSLASYWDYSQSWPAMTFTNLLDQSARLYQQYYLTDDLFVKADRASMASSLETRAPFVDPAVIAFASQLPMTSQIQNGTTKYWLRQVAAKYLPNDIVRRPKHGFPSPIVDWMRGPLRTWTDELMAHPVEGDCLEQVQVARLWHQFVQGQSELAPIVWRIAVWRQWLRTWL